MPAFLSVRWKPRMTLRHNGSGRKRMHDEGDAVRATQGASMAQAQWVHYLDTVAQLDYMRAVKQEITDRLDLHAGDVVLDAGCGTGDDARAMAILVGPTGRVVGLDIRKETLAEARRRAVDAGVAVEFMQGDVQRLPFTDATFTRCRAE